ncbi:MAG: hypothetical protein NC301_05135 [Bacteroides sp.]|nr:hypothetical protein [Bacteroides sp.]MCM1379820.1 hypothetical protein [Bacteroides sp.]MCM1446179.1 hypothetical protein [Prevotella sp.]
MTDDDKKRLSNDPDGLLTYEYIANHIGTDALDIDWLTDNIIRVDSNGQFTGSAARYLNAIDADHFSAEISRLIAATIDKDRERRYLAALMQGIWGDDCESRAAELSATNDNFRRIFKRLYPTSAI